MGSEYGLCGFGILFCVSLDESYVIHITYGAAGLPAHVGLLISRDPFGRFYWQCRILCVGNLVMAAGLCGKPVNRQAVLGVVHNYQHL